MSKKTPITATKHWVESVVIKHNFCPFAHKPSRHHRIRYQLSHATNEDDLINDLIDELFLLRDADHEKIETSILITPHCLTHFDQYNAFLDVIDILIKQFNLEGIIQVASFHPQYQFADLTIDDVRNYTNRSPFPMFHLILEDSIEKARLSYPNVEEIPEKNMARLVSIGIEASQQALEDCLHHEADDH